MGIVASGSTVIDPFNYLSRVTWSFGRFYTTKGGRSIESIYQACKGDAERTVKRQLNCEPNQIFGTTRYFARCSYLAPLFALEVKRGTKIEPVLAFCQATSDRATRLPLPIDLIDQSVSIPRGFTQEFIEEIEATLARDPVLDEVELETRFSSLNPQKQE